jgi:hypothetical protein
MAIDWFAIAPEIALTVTALLVLLADLNLRGDAKQLVNPIAAIGTVVAIVFTVCLWGEERTTFGTSFVVNEYAVVFKLLFLGSLLAILGHQLALLRRGPLLPGEYYFLLLTAFIGMLHHALGPRPAAVVRGARDRLDPRVRHGRPAQAVAVLLRGGAEVLPHRRAVGRADAVRDLDGLRLHRDHGSGGHRRGDRSRRDPTCRCCSHP